MRRHFESHVSGEAIRVYGKNEEKVYRKKKKPPSKFEAESESERDDTADSNHDWTSDSESEEPGEKVSKVESNTYVRPKLLHQSEDEIKETKSDSGKDLNHFLSSGYVDVSKEKKSKIWTGMVSNTFSLFEDNCHKKVALLLVIGNSSGMQSECKPYLITTDRLPGKQFLRKSCV